MLSRRLLLGAAAALPAGRALAQPIAFPAAGRRAWAAEVPVIRIGLLGGENEADRLGRFGAYARLFEETFGVPARLFPAADYAGVLQAFGARQIELASLGASGYAGAWMDTNGGVEPLVVAKEKDGSISYVSVMVVRADSGILHLSQMERRSLAWADPNSTSGYLIPRFELREGGIDPEPGKFFGRTGFGGGHEQAVAAVLQKQFDGAVTWASGVGEESEGFSRGNLRAMVEKGMLKMSDLRIIWTSRPILNGPLTVRTDLPQQFKDDMRDFHLALPTLYPAIYEQVERGGGQGYQVVKHADFQLFIDMRRSEAANRRQRG